MIESCAILGHSPNHFYCGWNEESQICNRIKQMIKDNIISLINDGVTEFNIAGDPGIGLWSAELINDIQKTNSDIEINIMEPYKRYTSLWPKMLKERYENLYNKCQNVFYCSGYKTKTALLEAYFTIIDESDIVLVVYESESEHVDIVDSAICFAEHSGSPIILIHTDTFEIEKIKSAENN